MSGKVWSLPCHWIEWRLHELHIQLICEINEGFRAVSGTILHFLHIVGWYKVIAPNNKAMCRKKAALRTYNSFRKYCSKHHGNLVSGVDIAVLIGVEAFIRGLKQTKREWMAKAMQIIGCCMVATDVSKVFKKKSRFFFACVIFVNIPDQYPRTRIAYLNFISNYVLLDCIFLCVH